MRSRLGSLLEQRIAEHKVKLSESICAGACADYPTYRQAVGSIAGLEMALNILEDLEKETD